MPYDEKSYDPAAWRARRGALALSIALVLWFALIVAFCVASVFAIARDVRADTLTDAQRAYVDELGLGADETDALLERAGLFGSVDMAIGERIGYAEAVADITQSMEGEYATGTDEAMVNR